MSVLFRFVVVTHLVSLMKTVFGFISCPHSQPLPQSLTGFSLKLNVTDTHSPFLPQGTGAASFDEFGNSKYQNRRTMSSSDRAMLNAFKEISTMADRINLPRNIVVSFLIGPKHVLLCYELLEIFFQCHNQILQKDD